MREERSYEQDTSGLLRITPACAGRTGYWANALWHTQGSPPRVREELLASNTGAFLSGITPACAGRTSRTANSFHGHGDHPRVCGKNNPRSVMQLKGWGSPPRVREELCIRLFIRTIDRITPACAGRTSGVIADIDRTKDHPRVCGKNYFGIFAEEIMTGSPPRVREERRSGEPLARFLGITPACAGRTTGWALIGGQKKDHPRVCGKNPET